MSYGSSWTHELLAVTLLGAAACGGSGGSTGVDGGVPDAGGDMDAPPAMTGDCEAGGRSSSDHYLPMAVGDEWSYEVVDPFIGGAPESKLQTMAQEFTPEGLDAPVFLQVTQKASGTTENWLRRQDDVVVRLQQQDFDILGNLERTTTYVPTRTRLDETPERLVEGATWSDDWIRVVEDPTGLETKRETVSDQWSVLGVDVPCETGWGLQLSCLHVSRVRLAGGTSQKEYYFARGYGKVREEGGVVEILSGCNLN